MLGDTDRSSNNKTPLSANVMPDLWAKDQHKITAAATPEGILSPAGDPTAPQIPAHVSSPKPTPAERLLQDELKVDAAQAKNLWDHIRDLLALLWWCGPQDEEPI